MSMRAMRLCVAVWELWRNCSVFCELHISGARSVLLVLELFWSGDVCFDSSCRGLNWESVAECIETLF